MIVAVNFVTVVIIMRYLLLVKVVFNGAHAVSFLHVLTLLNYVTVVTMMLLRRRLMEVLNRTDSFR